MINTELSIRIGPDGFSFLTTGQAGNYARGQFDSYDFDQIGRVVHAFDSVRVVCSQAEVVLVPAEFFSPDVAAQYLRAANMWSAGDVVLWSFVGGVVVVWAVDGEIYRALTERYSDSQWSHVQSELCSRFEPNTLRVAIDDRIVHFALFSNEGLVAARSAQYDDPDDMFFMMRRIGVGTKTEADRVVVRGVLGKINIERLGRYYKTIEVDGDILW